MWCHRISSRYFDYNLTNYINFHCIPNMWSQLIEALTHTQTKSIKIPSSIFLNNTRNNISNKNTLNFDKKLLFPYLTSTKKRLNKKSLLTKIVKKRNFILRLQGKGYTTAAVTFSNSGSGEELLINESRVLSRRSRDLRFSEYVSR